MNEAKKPTKKQQSSEIVKPAESIDSIKKRWDDFSKVKKELLSKEDIMTFNNRPYVKESGWRKIATAFNISLIIQERHREEHENEKGKYYIWRYYVKAKAPNGRIQEAEGSCTSQDPFFSKKRGEEVTPNESDIIHTAQTVAYNRAISDLVGGGQLSAEELKSLNIKNVNVGKTQSRKTSPRKTESEYINDLKVKKLMSELEKSIADKQLLLDFLVDKYGKKYAYNEKKNRHSVNLIKEEHYTEILTWIQNQKKPDGKRKITEEEKEKSDLVFPETENISKEMIKKLKGIFKRSDYEVKGIRMVLEKYFNKSKIEDLTQEEAEEVERKLRKGVFF